MLRKFRDIKGMKIQGLDGDIGKVHDLYFDDQSWDVRYLVDDTGRGLVDEHLVLIPPRRLGTVDWQAGRVPVAMTVEQIRHARPRSDNPPVEKQPPPGNTDLWLWPYAAVPMGSGVGMGMGAGAAAVPFAPIPVETARDRDAQAQADRFDPHLRSAKHVRGYYIHAADGSIGHVEDFIVDDETWSIRYIEVDTRNWRPGRRVLVSPHWIERLGVESREVHVGLEREVIKSSPAYDEAGAVSRDYETALFAHYGRKGYWISESNAGSPLH